MTGNEAHSRAGNRGKNRPGGVQSEGPSTDVELWDVLQEMFGLGDFDPLFSDHPFWEVRTRGIAALRAAMRKRHISVEQAYLAAQYCKRHQISVWSYGSLFRHLSDAIADQRVAKRRAARQDLEDQIAEAIAYEQALPDSPFIDRLIRATDREQVLAEWRSARGR